MSPRIANLYAATIDLAGEVDRMTRPAHRTATHDDEGTGR